MKSATSWSARASWRATSCAAESRCGCSSAPPAAVFLNGTGLPPGSSPFSARRRSRALCCRSPTPWRKRPLLRLSASGKRRARRRGSSPSRSAGMSTRFDFAAVTGLEEVLASSAFMFSNLWLNDALSRSLNPTLPQIENTDGDPLEFITVHFPLISKAKLPAIRTALDDLPSLCKESDGFWNWIEAKAPPRKAAKRRSTAAQTFGATMDDGAIVLGTIELGTKTVTLSVNSEARAARGRAMLEPVLAGLARSPPRAAEHRTDDGVIARAFGTGHRSPPAGRGAKHRSSDADGSLSQDAGRADPGARQPDAAQGGQDFERPEEGDRVAEDAGEPISAAASRGSDGRLRLHVAVARTRRWRRA